MSELPKIVTSKLAERQMRPGGDATSHPDPDLLTALIERALPERERGAILGHLANCGPCREIVALAQPAAEDSLAQVPRPRRSWSSGFVLRWGALAACAVLAVALVVRHNGGGQAPLVAEQKAVLPATTAMTASVKDVTPTPPVEPAVDKKSADNPVFGSAGLSRSVRGNEETVDAIAPAKARRSSHPLSFGPSAPMSNNNAFAANNDASRNDLQVTAQAAPVVPTENVGGTVGKAASPPPDFVVNGRQIVPLSAGAAPPESDAAVRARKSDAVALHPAPSPSKDKTPDIPAASEAVEVTAEVTTDEIATKPAEAGEAYGSLQKQELHASSSGANLASLTAAHQAAMWQITDAGDLQRSPDGGKTWESVSLDPPARLRVIATAGFQVWAGGNDGALFHSQDGGGHFAMVKVHKRHNTLTGDIVTLSFQDPLHGRLETAAHEVWITADGGRSWRRPDNK